jgi:hypothetical protein
MVLFDFSRGEKPRKINTLLYVALTKKGQKVDLLRESVDLKCVSVDPCRRNNHNLQLFLQRSDFFSCIGRVFTVDVLCKQRFILPCKVGDTLQVIQNHRRQLTFPDVMGGAGFLTILLVGGAGEVVLAFVHGVGTM